MADSLERDSTSDSDLGPGGSHLNRAPTNSQRVLEAVMEEQSDSIVTGQAEDRTWEQAAGYLGQLQNGMARPASVVSSCLEGTELKYKASVPTHGTAHPTWGASYHPTKHPRRKEGESLWSLERSQVEVE